MKLYAYFSRYILRTEMFYDRIENQNEIVHCSMIDTISILQLLLLLFDNLA